MECEARSSSEYEDRSDLPNLDLQEHEVARLRQEETSRMLHFMNVFRVEHGLHSEIIRTHPDELVSKILWFLRFLQAGPSCFLVFTRSKKVLRGLLNHRPCPQQPGPEPEPKLKPWNPEDCQPQSLTLHNPPKLLTTLSGLWPSSTGYSTVFFNSVLTSA